LLVLFFHEPRVLGLGFRGPGAGSGFRGEGAGVRGKGYGGTRKVDIRLPEKGNSNSNGARPVY